MCSLVVLWSFPFTVVAAFTRDLPTSTVWLALTGTVTAGTLVLLVITLKRTMQWARVGRLLLDPVVYSAGLFLTIALQLITMFTGMEFLYPDRFGAGTLTG